MNTFLGWIHAILPRFLSSFEKTSPDKRGGSFRPTHPSIVNTLLSASRKTLLAPKQVLLHANLGCTKKTTSRKYPTNQPQKPFQISLLKLTFPYNNSVSREVRPPDFLAPNLDLELCESWSETRGSDVVNSIVSRRLGSV